MNKYYEKMKRIVNNDIGEIPKVITADWLLKRYNDETCFKFWFFTYSDLRGHIFDKNIPYELKRLIEFSTKTILDDNNKDYFKITDDMFKPDDAVIKLQEEGYDGEGMDVAVIDYGFEQLHDEIKDELVSYKKMRNTKPHYHGTVVASYLCGKNIGVVPKARLHFYKIVEGPELTDQDQIDDVIKALEDIYEENIKGANIRVVNLSSIMHRKDPRYSIMVNKLEEQGCFVIDARDFWLQYVPLNIDHNRKEYYYSKQQELKLDESKKAIGIPTGCMIPLHETKSDYKYCGEASGSWSIPILSGLFTLALQINPDLTFDEFNDIARENKKVQKDGKTIFDIEKTFDVIKSMNIGSNKSI